MWSILVGSLLAAQAQIWAQIPIDAKLAAGILQRINQPANASLTCDIHSIAPVLNFGFRYQAGYLASVPIAQFGTQNHWIAALIRVLPTSPADNHHPVYLLKRFDLPATPLENDSSANLAGGFLLGPGNYHADIVLFDQTQGACRADWPIEIKSSSHNLRMPPDTVMPLSANLAADWSPKADGTRQRITILLHAAPLNDANANLQAADVLLSVSSLTTLLEQLPSHSVRLVAFNLQTDKEVFRSGQFTPTDLEPLTKSLDAMQLNTVDYRALKSENRELLANLIRREAAEQDRSNITIILGPDAPRQYRPIIGQVAPNAGKIFYLQYRLSGSKTDQNQSPQQGKPDPRPLLSCQANGIIGCNRGPGSSQPPTLPAVPTSIVGPTDAPSSSDPDAIASTVKRLKGKTFVIRNPQDFARAMQRISKN